MSIVTNVMNYVQENKNLLHHSVHLHLSAPSICKLLSWSQKDTDKLLDPENHLKTCYNWKTQIHLDMTCSSYISFNTITRDNGVIPINHGAIVTRIPSHPVDIQPTQRQFFVYNQGLLCTNVHAASTDTSCTTESDSCEDFQNPHKRIINIKADELLYSIPVYDSHKSKSMEFAANHSTKEILLVHILTTYLYTIWHLMDANQNAVYELAIDIDIENLKACNPLDCQYKIICDKFLRADSTSDKDSGHEVSVQVPDNQSIQDNVVEDETTSEKTEESSLALYMREFSHTFPPTITPDRHIVQYCVASIGKDAMGYWPTISISDDSGDFNGYISMTDKEIVGAFLYDKNGFPTLPKPICCTSLDLGDKDAKISVDIMVFMIDFVNLIMKNRPTITNVRFVDKIQFGDKSSLQMFIDQCREYAETEWWSNLWVYENAT